MSIPYWRCPHCHWPLALEGRQFHCVGGHTFDQAKEGYVNLLPVNRKRSTSPGDDRHMLRNRREFLEQGHYRPLAELLARLCVKRLEQTLETGFSVLDTGCGEGYYTGVIAAALMQVAPGREIRVGGIDIARDAARMAAKRYPDCRFAVASNADVPVPGASIDCALRIFAPSANAEIDRVLKPDGCFISVIPGPRHLFGLRELVYERPRQHTTGIEPIEGMRHIRREKLDYEMTLAGRGNVVRLLAMTPYYWQASEQKQACIAGMERLELEVSFRVDCYRKD